MKHGRTAMLATALVISAMVPVAGRAQAGGPEAVKAGVDAWERGDYSAAVQAWRPLADAGDADAQFNLAQAYKLGRGVPADLNQAEDYYRRAALQGHQKAEEMYGLALHQRDRFADAVTWLDRAASRGEPRAQFVLGTMYFNGEGVAKDWVRAYALVLRAGDTNLPQAATTLDQMDLYLSVQERQRALKLAATLPGRGPRKARAIGTPAIGLAAAPKPPGKVPATTASAAPPSAQGAWRVQLGAFKDAANARALWGRLSGQVAPFAGRTPSYVASGGVTRLQVGPFAGASEAGAACTAVKATGTPCLPVRP